MDGFEREERDFFFAYNMILDLPIDEHAKIVYICLCRFSDGDKKAFPSYASIGKKCSIKSRTTIKKAIDKLMEVGLLDYKTRKTNKGGQTSNLYFIYNRPNEEVQKKYAKVKFSKDKEKPSFCSTDEQLPAQQMDTPCPADGHEVYPSKYIHLKNTQSINQDGQIDSDKMDELFLAIGVEQLTHTENIKFMKMVLGNLLSTGRVGKITYPQYEILKTLRNLTPQKMDNVLDRYAIQSQKRRIPSPFEYIKTCVFSAGKDIATPLPTQAGNQTDDHIPTYDMDEYTRLSMERLVGGQKGDDQKCPA